MLSLLAEPGLLDGLPAKGGFRQVRFAQARLGYRLLTVCCTNTIERAMCGSHVTTQLMTGQRNLLCLCAHSLGDDLHFFDSAF